jgi:hypothetical protein
MIYEEITNEDGIVTIKQTLDNGLERWIPTDFANSDYQAYLKSLDEASTL